MIGRASSSSSISRIVAIGRDPLLVRCRTFFAQGMNVLILIYTNATSLKPANAPCAAVRSSRPMSSNTQDRLAENRLLALLPAAELEHFRRHAEVVPLRQ